MKQKTMNYKTIAILTFLFLTRLIAFSQDTIIKKDGTKIPCKIKKNDSTNVYYKTVDNELGKFFVAKSDIRTIILQNKFKPQMTDKEFIDSWQGSVGLGFGQIYGGIGVNVLYFPQKNIGIFGGVGHAIASLGYNVGARLRFTPYTDYKIHPYLTAMYGYNAALVVKGNSGLNRIDYGFTIGAGIDIRTKYNKKGFWTLAILKPLRNNSISYYTDKLNSFGNTYVTVKHDFWPVTISLGYQFIL